MRAPAFLQLATPPPFARRPARSALGLALATMLATCPAPCRAQQTPSMALVDGGEDGTTTGDENAALLAEAIAEYDAGRYPEALALFRRAHALAPTARTLRAIGMTSFELRQYVTAVTTLRAALVSTERPLTDTQRGEVEALIARALRFVAIVTLEVEPADAEVLVDGEPIVREPDGTLLLDHGPHTLTARHRDYVTKSVPLQLEPGVSPAFTIALVPRPPVEEPELRPVAPPPPFAAHRGSDDTLGWTAVGLGAAAVLATAAATAMGVIALTDRDTLASECDGYVCSASLRSVRDRAEALAVGADVTGVAAAGLGVTAIVLAIVAASQPATDAPSLGASCTTDGCIGWLSGRF